MNTNITSVDFNKSDCGLDSICDVLDEAMRLANGVDMGNIEEQPAGADKVKLDEFMKKTI